MGKCKSMTFFPPICHPFSGKQYFADNYKNCIQIEFNKDGSVDLYDYNTTEHLKHLKLK